MVGRRSYGGVWQARDGELNASERVRWVEVGGGVSDCSPDTGKRARRVIHDKVPLSEARVMIEGRIMINEMRMVWWCCCLQRHFLTSA